MSDFKIAFDKNHRPEINNLDLYLDSEIAHLFHKFSDLIMENYNLRFAIPTWNETHGWTYRIGRSGIFLLSGLTIQEDGFQLDSIKVNDDKTYQELIHYVDRIYQEQKDSFQDTINKKNKEQIERTKKRKEREKLELDKLQGIIVQDKYNQFHWPAKLNISDLNKLYQYDAKRIHDEEIASDIGTILYLRCTYGKSDMELMEKYAIRCHHCGEILYGDSDFRTCSCGYQYSYKEYRRSYRRNNMPTGAAAKVFDQYIIDWPRAKTYQEKIILIDRLLHEFHLSLVSGTIHRPVAMNFIDGSREKINKIINQLAL